MKKNKTEAAPPSPPSSPPTILTGLNASNAELVVILPQQLLYTSHYRKKKEK